MLLTSLVHCPRFRRSNPRVLDAFTVTTSTCLCQLTSSVVTDGKAEILSTVNSFKGVTMELVYGVSLVTFVGADVNDLAFLWVELHLPLSFLFLQSKKILLD